MAEKLAKLSMGIGALALSTLAAGPAQAGWSTVEDDTMRGARLCTGTAEAPACLTFSCAAPGAALDLAFAEPASLPGFGRLELSGSVDGAAPHALPVKLDPASPHRSGPVEFGAGALALFRAELSGGRELLLSHGDGAWSADLTGAPEAFAALDAACAPAAPRAKEPTPLAELSGQVPVLLDREGWQDAPGTVKALAIGAHGWRTTRHFRMFGVRSRVPVAKAYSTGPGRYLLIAELCGAGDYFGPGGCGLYVSSKTSGHWTVVTVRPAGTELTLDLDRRSESGWPDIIAADGQRWVWSEDAYRPRL